MASQTVGVNLAVLLVLLAQHYTPAIADSCPISARAPNYEFHGTKTIYSDAYNALSSKDQLKGSFDDDSLNYEHQKLVNDGCKPLVFYFVGRHSARFPDAEDIEVMNKALLDIQAKLRFISSTMKCKPAYSEILEWKSKMTPAHDNLITELGAVEEREIAKRFKNIYPEFFDSRKADIKVGVTKKIRTAQTAVEFMQAVDNWEVENACKRDMIPTNNLNEASYNLQKILKNECYSKLTSAYAMPELTFHDECEKLQGKLPKNKLVQAIKDPKVVAPIADKVAEKLQFSKGSITPDMLDAMYSVCKFENAISNNSVWCTVFDKSDIEAFEYIEDVKSYLATYGQSANTKQACPLVSNLVKRFNESMTMTGNNSEKKKSFFYFSHAGAMKIFLAAFGIFEDNKSYTEQKINEFITTLKVPKKRTFRSSLIVPFSANMAFSLYKCQKPGKTETKHKLLAFVTEHPVEIKGCEDTDCNFKKFMKTFKNMEDCDLKQICKPIAVN